MTGKLPTVFAMAAALWIGLSPTSGQELKRAKPVDKWVTVTAAAAGTDLKAKDEAVAVALRKAVEEACGVFLKAQSQTRDYKAVYDKVFADTVGYVIEHEVLKTWTEEGLTHARVRARVSTKKFEAKWADIAHIVHREGNPRVIIVIAESTHWSDTGPSVQVEEGGTVQTKVEDFFLDKGIQLVDRETAKKVSKRDIMIATSKDDTAEVIALGARFKADVFIVGEATAKYGKRIHVAGATMYQYVASLRARAIRTDSGQVMVSKTFGPVTANSLQRRGGEDKAMAKLAEEAAPKLLSAVVEAWRKQIHVTRNIRLNISGMTYTMWKKFSDEAGKLRGVKALRRREITAGVANIDVEYEYSTEMLADRLIELKSFKLGVTEITANRIKLKVIQEARVPSPAASAASTGPAPQ